MHTLEHPAHEKKERMDGVVDWGSYDRKRVELEDRSGVTYERLREFCDEEYGITEEWYSLTEEYKIASGLLRDRLLFTKKENQDFDEIRELKARCEELTKALRDLDIRLEAVIRQRTHYQKELQEIIKEQVRLHKDTFGHLFN